MGWLIITLLLAFVEVGALLTFMLSKPTAESDARFYALGTLACAFVVWVVITVAVSYNSVGQLQVGLAYSFSGKLSDSPKPPGVVWLAPWQHLKTENVGIQKDEFILNADNAAVSKDQQAIYADVQLNYQVEPAQIVTLFKTVGPNWKNVLIEGRMLQDIKQVTAGYTAAEITTKRPELRAATRAQMQAELQKYDIHVVDVLYKNIGYSAAYRDAIEAKNAQVQQSKQAEAKVSQAKAEADQAVAAARGQAEATVLRAQADAKALRLQGEALKNNPGVLQLQAINKLAPNASVIICTGQTCPSFLPQAATVSPGGTRP